MVAWPCVRGLTSNCRCNPLGLPHGTSDVREQEHVPRAVWVDNPGFCGGTDKRAYDILT